MVTSKLILFILALALTTWQCPIDPANISPSLSCVENIICTTPSANDSRILFQNCNKEWYYGTSSLPIFQLNFTFPNYFVSNDKLALNMKAGPNYAIINYDNVALYYYPLGTVNFNIKLESDCTFLDYDSRKVSGS